MKTRYSLADVQAALDKNGQDVLKASLSLGCSPATIYNAKRAMREQNVATITQAVNAPTPLPDPPPAEPITIAESGPEPITEPEPDDTVDAFDIRCTATPAVPTPDPFWIERESYRDMAAYLKMGLIVGLTGPAGVGKTAGAQQFAAKERLPFYRASLDTSDGLRKLFGRISLRDARTYFVESLALKTLRGASKTGAVLLLDEITKADPTKGALLHELLDSRQFVVNEAKGGRGEVITIPSNVHIICAGNPPTGAFAGTMRQNAALINRMVVVQVPPFTGEDYKTLLDRFDSESSLEEQERADVARFFGEVTKAVTQQGCKVQVSVRNLKMVLKARIAGIPMVKAITHALVNQADFIGDKDGADLIKGLLITHGLDTTATATT